MGEVHTLRINKLFAYYIIILTLLLSHEAQAATRRRTNTSTTPAPTQNQPVTQSQTGSGEALTDEDEQALRTAAQQARRAGIVQLNFKDMDLVRFISYMAELLEENIIVPPGINTKITIVSPHSVTISQAREIMLSMLQMYNFSLQNMGSYSIVRQGGNSPAPNVMRGRAGPGFGEQTVTYIVPIDYVTVETLIPALQQTFGPALIVLPVGNGRDILLQGRATDVNKGVEFLRKMDTPDSARFSRTFELKYADPATITSQINAIAQSNGPLQGVNAIADAPSRKVIIVGSRAALSRAAAIIKELDVDQKNGDFHIYRLKNIDATTAAEQVGKVLASTTAMLGAEGARFPATVVPDIATNSLIFAATQRQYESLVPILEAIDIQSKQILIRGFIAEINVTNLENNGIDWSVIGGQMWDDLLLGGSVAMGQSSVPSTFMQWFNDLSKREELLDRNGSTYSVTNYNPMALMYATINLLKRYDAVNVLSVPRLMCLDNKEGSFQVGNVIPFKKGTVSDTSSTSLQTNYDYKDTGLTLTITPHIRSGNLVALDIKQTTEELLFETDGAPRTSKREVNTSVIVGDGETIILGGMMREMETSIKTRTPGFSYIPLVGGLFKNLSKQKQKLDLIIFLTPQIIQTPEEMRGATLRTAGFTNRFTSPDYDLNMLNLTPDYARSELTSIDISPVEADIDRRFREMYQKSLRRR